MPEIEIGDTHVFKRVNETICRFPGYHDDVTHEFNMKHWYIMTVRLIFAFLFQWTVSAAGRVLAWIIPDRPRSLDLKIKREEYLAKEALRNYKIKTGKRQPDQEVLVSDEEEEVGTEGGNNTNVSDEQQIHTASSIRKKKKKSVSRNGSNLSPHVKNSKDNNSSGSLDNSRKNSKDHTQIEITLNGNSTPIMDNSIGGESLQFRNGSAEKEPPSSSSRLQNKKQQRPSSWNGVEMQDMGDKGPGSNLKTTSPKHSFDYLTQML